MAKTSQQMVEEFQSFIPFVEQLQGIDEELWHRPIAEGKWTIKDIVAHIMLWDKYFYSEAIEKIKQGQPVTVKHLNFDEFNAAAIEYAKTQSTAAIIEQFVVYRKKIITAISGLPEEDYVKVYKDGDKKNFSIRGFLRGFIPHDKHHGKQINSFIKSGGA